MRMKFEMLPDQMYLICCALADGCNGAFSAKITYYGSYGVIFTCVYSSRAFSTELCSDLLPYTFATSVASREQAIEVFQTLSEFIPTR